MYEPEKAHIRKQTNNRLPSPQAAAGEGASLHAAASGSAGLGSGPGTTLYSTLKSLIFFWIFD